MQANIKTIQVTLDSQIYTDLIQKFELNNQDELDACIGSFIEDKLANSSLQESLDEYYNDGRNPHKTIKSLQNDLENPMWGN